MKRRRHYIISFSENDEIDDKLGVLIHIADINDEELVDADSKVYPEFDQKIGYPTMFDMDNREKIKQGMPLQTVMVQMGSDTLNSKVRRR